MLVQRSTWTLSAATLAFTVAINLWLDGWPAAFFTTKGAAWPPMHAIIGPPDAVQLAREENNREWEANQKKAQERNRRERHYDPESIAINAAVALGLAGLAMAISETMFRRRIRKARGEVPAQGSRWPGRRRRRWGM